MQQVTIENGIQWNNHIHLGDLNFADGIALIEKNEKKLQVATVDLEWEASKISLCISTEDSKVMHSGDGDTANGIVVGPQRLKKV